MNKKWTNNEDEYLRINSKIKYSKDLASDLNRSISSIHARMSRLKIAIQVEKICDICGEKYKSRVSHSKICGKESCKREKYLRYQKNHYKENKNDYKNYWKKHKKQSNRQTKKYNYRHRLEVLNYYSNGTMRCAKCGNDDVRVLDINHIGGGGRRHRKKNNIKRLFLYLRRNNYPDGYNVLCCNCNWRYYLWNVFPSSIYKNMKGNTELVLRIKTIAFQVYSKGYMECALCGEDDVDVLTIDHIKGGGMKHLAKIKRKSGQSFYYWLIYNNFPSGFRILCRNCQRLEKLRLLKLKKVNVDEWI